MARLPDLVATMVLLPMALPALSAAESDRPPTGARQIYRCEVAEVVTFSDRPCGVGIQPYELDLSRVSILEAIAPPRPAVPNKPAVARRAVLPRQDNAAAKNAKADACRRLQQALRTVASRMRAGYTVKAGERLRAQHRELEAKRRAQRC